MGGTLKKKNGLKNWVPYLKYYLEAGVWDFSEINILSIVSSTKLANIQLVSVFTFWFVSFIYLFLANALFFLLFFHSFSWNVKKIVLKFNKMGLGFFYYWEILDIDLQVENYWMLCAWYDESFFFITSMWIEFSKQKKNICLKNTFN